MCDEEEEQRETLMAMLLDSVAPLVKMISLGSAPIRSATCCSERKTIRSQGLSNSDLMKCCTKFTNRYKNSEFIKKTQLMVNTLLHSTL